MTWVNLGVNLNLTELAVDFDAWLFAFISSVVIWYYSWKTNQFSVDAESGCFINLYEIAISFEKCFCRSKLFKSSRKFLSPSKRGRLLEKSFQNILKLTKRFFQSKSGCSKTVSLKSEDFVLSRLKTQDSRLKTQDSRLKTQDSRLKSILTDSLSNPVTKEIQSRGIWLRIRSYPLE